MASPRTVLVVASIVLGGPALFGAPVSTTDGRLQQLTEAFARFDARDMAGQRWTAGRLAGQVVVLDFWASWCAPCLSDVPWLRRVHEQGASARVRVIGVSLDVTDRRTLVAWLNRHRIDWPQIWEERGYEGEMARQFDVSTLPTSLVVAPDGRAVAVNLRTERLLAAVNALLEESAAGRSARSILSEPRHRYTPTAAP